MELNSEISERSEPKSVKKKAIIVSIVIAVIIIAVAATLYYFLYMVPYDKAVANFNNAVEEFNTAVTSLEERNKEFDDSIASLNSIVHADSLPFDETLLSEAEIVLENARNMPKDSAPAIPEMPSTTDEINIASSEIIKIAAQVDTMGDYSDVIASLSETKSMYETLIQQFQGSEATVLWVGINDEATVLRFVAEITNSNPYALTDVVTEWVAYDNNDAIVGSSEGSRPDIPANGNIYYVGGAGSANLSDTPDRIELKIVNEGLLTKRETPNISVSNIQLIDNGYNYFTVTADCITDSDINTADMDGEIILKDANGKIIGADFWGAENLPDTLSANGKFALSENFFDLPAMPASAEVYVYHTGQ